ncbi:hypothetical protein [Pseudomonas oryzihabitans]|uniref:hypothetical protein n=1 Tax=Pseudomonas oryzihabitans TaxID=47885 RepID=UPI0015E33922|nr:hypothetical protein [Pseudomonas psychrotolerans]MBA1211541.1 hypothetical protein [Pseudomonas psychrotolerans]
MAKKRIALLLDGDFLVYSAMSAAEEEVDWGEDIWSLQCDHKKARAILRASIRGIKERLKEFNDAELVMIFSGDNNWRKGVLETYKANRKGKRKPVGYPEFVRQCLEDTETYLRTFKWDGLEGDDVIGILATNPEFLGVDEAIPVSCDKDFKTIPGRFYHLTTNKVLNHTEEEANRWHLYQTIKGDVTDGYGGIPGCGEKVGTVDIMEWLQAPTYFYQAVKVMKSGPRKGEEVPYWTSRTMEEANQIPEMEPAVNLWDCIVSLAAKQGMSEEDLLKQAQVARILRSSDFDWDKKEPILWKPS